MKYQVKSLFLVFLIVLSGLPDSDAQQGAELVDELIDSLLSVTQLPSFSLAILEDGEIAFAKAWGYADVEKQIKATPQTRYRLASVSKLLTVSALAKLVKESKIGLDSPVQEHIPGFPQVEGVTCRLLAGHLAGIAHYQMEDKIRRDRHYSNMEESLDVFRDSPRAGKPGEQYIYSTHGYTLLSAVIERAAGQPFLDYLEESVLTPLDMIRTGPDDRLNISPEMSVLYHLSDRRATRIEQPEDPSYKWAGGGMIGTPSDLVRLANGYFSGFFNTEIVREMWTSQATLAGEETGVGIGWRIGEDFRGRNIVHHAGAMGGARSVLILYPEEKAAIATTTNAAWVSVVELNGMILLEVYRSAELNKSPIQGHFSYTGECWDGETAGDIRISESRGSISTPEPLRNWFGGSSVDRLPVIHIRDELWAIVTPYGLAPLYLTASRDTLEGKMVIREDRVWRFTIK